MAGPFSSAPSQSSATFDDLIVTTPTQVNGADVIPQEVTGGRWQPDGSGAQAQSCRLGRWANDADPAGQFGAVCASRHQPRDAGARHALHQFRARHDRRFERRCAPVRRAAAWSSASRTIPITRSPISIRTANTAFPSAAATPSAPEFTGQIRQYLRGTHLLLVVANDNTIYFYIDRQLVGSTDNTAQDGEVGIAVVNFEPNTTACHYTNFWLWNWS